MCSDLMLPGNCWKNTQKVGNSNVDDIAGYKHDQGWCSHEGDREGTTQLDRFSETDIAHLTVRDYHRARHGKRRVGWSKRTVADQYNKGRQ